MLKITFPQFMPRYLNIGFSLLASIIFMMSVGYAAKPGLHDLLDYGPPEDMSSPMAATATFLQVTNTSGGTDATSISKLTLKYFTSTDCSGATAGTYTTPDGTSFTINTSTSFNLNATSTYSAGNSIPLTMSTINSVAIFVKSTNSNTPQANFTGSCGTNPSFCCVQIDCSSGTQCTATSAIGTQNLQLKTTTAIGDPADGGVIACKNTGAGSNLYNLVTPSSDNSMGIEWGGSGTATTATSTTDGATNTTTIVTALGAGSSYAARTCSTYTTTGGFTTGWFLSAKDQLNCLYGNKTAVGGFADNFYWSSTEADANLAWPLFFGDGTQDATLKSNPFHVRCARAFTP